MTTRDATTALAGATAGVRRYVRDDGALFLVGGLVFAVFLVWHWRDGGFAPTDWLPAGVFLLALLVVVLFTAADVRRLPRVVALSVAAVVAFAAWNALSIAWADVRGVAWDGANRTIVYAVVFSLFAVAAWSRRSVALLLGLYAGGVAAVGTVSFVRASTGGDPAAAFISGRLSVPIEYANANAGIALAAVWPALYLASRRQSPALVRAAMLATAGVLVELALLAQSRTSLVAVPLVAIAYLVFVPTRLRVVLAMGLVGACIALFGPGILDVYEALVNSENADALIVDARRSLVWSALVLFAAGLVWGLADRRVTVSVRATRAIGTALVVAAALLAVATVGASLVFGDPSARASRAWEQFRTNEKDDFNRTHFASGFGTNRYDLWRVAALEFWESPVVGIGSDNYAAPYLLRRETDDEEPLYPHSLPLRVVSQTGLVGGVLFGTWMVAAYAAILGRRRLQRSRDAQALAVTAGTLTLYWLVQGSADWFWEIPALGGPAVAALALGLRVTDGPAGGTGSPHRAVAVAAAAASVLVAASFVLPWLSARQVERAAATWFESPAVSFDRLETARALNPLSDQPDVIAGVIARRSGDLAREREAFTRALDRNPTNWYALLELALLDAPSDREAALRRLAAARRLNPREEILADVERRIRTGQSVDAATIEQQFIDRANELVRRG